MILQHQDINAPRKTYASLKPDELLVTKIWYTIQGEGPFAGYPAVFVRLAGCNRGKKEGMGCEFCDTYFKVGSGKIMTFDDILDAAVLMSAFNTVDNTRLGSPIMVVTGGEPMIQDNLTAFIMRSQERNLWGTEDTLIQIESNGDRLAAGWLDGCGDGFYSDAVSLVVSPKMSRTLGDNGKVSYRYRLLSPAVMEAVTALKFVMSGDPESAYFILPDYAFEGIVPVYVSPLTEYLKPHDPTKPVSMWDRELIDEKLTRRNYERAVYLVMRHGLHISLQTHLFLNLS